MAQQPLFLNSRYNNYLVINNDLTTKRLQCNNIEINQDSFKKNHILKIFKMILIQF